MKIVIAGAGSIGFHLAKLLTHENQDITLIDTNEEILQYAGTNLDVLTIRGDAASIDVLKQAKVERAKIFLAVTTSEKTNLLTAILAKQLGAKKTIARIDNPEYLEKTQQENFNRLGVDTLISPQLLAAKEIEKLIKRGTFTDIFEFEEGKISIVGFTLDTTCPLINKTVGDVEQMHPEQNYKGIAILRGQKTIIPNKNTMLWKGDHLYLVTKNKNIDGAHSFVGKELKPIKRVMIIGDTPLALRTAQILENTYYVSLVLENKKMAKSFLETLNKTLVVNGDPSNIDILKEEGIEQMDAFIALTPNSETNIITSLMAEELGVYKTIAQVDNINYTHISQNIGVDTIINKKLIAANNIFRFVRKGRVEAVASLHGVDAEVIEFVVHKSNRLLKHPIKDLHLPEKAVIAGVIRGEQSFIPEPDFKLEIDDKVIVFTLPEALYKVEQIFK